MLRDGGAARLLRAALKLSRQLYWRFLEVLFFLV